MGPRFQAKWEFEIEMWKADRSDAVWSEIKYLNFCQKKVETISCSSYPNFIFHWLENIVDWVKSGQQNFSLLNLVLTRFKTLFHNRFW